MRLETFSTLSSHQNSIVTTNTPQAISGDYEGTAPSTTDIPCRTIAVQASSTNASCIFIGPVGMQCSSGWPLEAMQSITIDTDNINKLRIAGTQDDRYAWIVVR